jgi:hypothetical protein
MTLERFERRLERFVEGAFARIFRSGLQPVEIGRRLTREMDLRRTVAPRGVLTPNAFGVLLSGPDRAKFQAIEDELSRELVEVAKDHARREGYTFLGPVSVTIETDPGLRPGTLLVSSDMAPEQGTATLVLPDGRRVVLEPESITLGRLPECELSLADAGVSRRHAQVRRSPDGGWVVVDLGSTNGTKVNGVRINGARPLGDGDEITVGSTTIRFEAAAGAPNHSAGRAPVAGGSATAPGMAPSGPRTGGGTGPRTAGGGGTGPRTAGGGGTGPRTAGGGGTGPRTAGGGVAGGRRPASGGDAPYVET